MHRAFEDDPRTATIGSAGHGHFLYNLSIVSQEYALLQMSKLHDPACQQKRVNLTIEYVIEYGGWDAETKRNLLRLASELGELYAHIQAARNRTIAHNDLATILDDTPLGAFPAGADDSYFAKLEEFASIVQQEVAGYALPFDHFAQTDVAMLLKALASSDVREA
jgi:hypothetical protein